MRKHKNPKIDAVCAFCEFASTCATEDAEPRIFCRYKKTVTPDGSCRRFRYDPLKREIHTPRTVTELDPDSVLADK